MSKRSDGHAAKLPDRERSNSKAPTASLRFCVPCLECAVLDWVPDGSSRRRPSDHAGMDRDRDGCGHLLRWAGPGAVYQSHDGPLAEDSCTDFPRKLSDRPGADAPRLDYELTP